MTYLELVNYAIQRGGFSGGSLATLETGVTAYQDLLIVDSIANAWDELQQEDLWKWMQFDASFTTTEDVADYDYTDLGLSRAVRKYREKSFLIFKTSDGSANEGRLVYYPEDKWNDEVRPGILARTANQPYRVHEHNGVITLDPKPDDGGYTVRAQGWLVPTALEDDDDEPDMPEWLHKAIVWRALVQVFDELSDPSRYNTALMRQKDWDRKVRESQLPDLRFGGKAFR